MELVVELLVTEMAVGWSLAGRPAWYSRTPSRVCAAKRRKSSATTCEGLGRLAEIREGWCGGVEVRREHLRDDAVELGGHPAPLVPQQRECLSCVGSTAAVRPKWPARRPSHVLSRNARGRSEARTARRADGPLGMPVRDMVGPCFLPRALPDPVWPKAKRHACLGMQAASASSVSVGCGLGYWGHLKLSRCPGCALRCMGTA